MTSRRYSELSNVSNMSLIDEGDENTTPVRDANNTPRAKFVPPKKTRISESPLTSHQQNHQFRGGDRNLEETYVEQPSVLGTPGASIKVGQETASAGDATQPQMPFRFDRNLEETYVEQPSVLGTPGAMTTVKSGLQETPATDATQKSVSFNLDKSLDETIIKPSFFATPKPPSKMQQQDSEDLSEQENMSFEVEKSFVQQTTTVQVTEEHLFQPRAAVSSEAATTTSSSKRMESDASVLGSSMMSFLEEEMQVYADEQCKCVRFESIIKEYTVLREKFQAVSKPAAAASANSTFKIDEDEVFRLNEEIIKIKEEVDDYKKAAELAKKEAEDFQFVLDEEKRRAKNRISDLQKENFALSDELEALKIGASGDATATEQSQHDNLNNELQEELAQLKENNSKASTEIEEYKAKVEAAQKEVDGIKADFIAEKEAWNAQFADLQAQKNTEVESLKAELGDTVTLKTELAELKEKLAIFDAVVQTGYEIEEMCKKLKEKNDAIKNEKADLQVLCDTKDAEFTQLKEAFAQEKSQLQGQLADLDAQLLKATDETEVYKVKAEDLQKEFKELQKSINTRIAEVQQQKDAEIESLKVAVNSLQTEKSDLNNLLASKDAEIADFKNSVQNEMSQLQEKLSACNELLSKANGEVEEYKSAAANAKSDADKLQSQLNKGKEFMNSKLAVLESQKNAEIKSLKATIDALGNGKVQLEDRCNKKDVEVDQMKAAFEEEKTQLQGQLADLDAQLLKATDETEVYKVKAEDLQKEFKELQKSINTRIAEVQQQKDAEIESLKVAVNSLQTEKSDLNNLLASKDAEIADFKNSVQNEMSQLQEKLSACNELLSKANGEVEEYKSAAANAKSDADKLQSQLNKGEEFMNSKLAVLESQKNAEIKSLKATIDALGNGKVQLEDRCNKKDVEVDQMKAAFEEEKTQLQQQIAELNEQYSKATKENDKLNKKIEKLYDDLDAADNERKELAESVFNLTTKLSKYTSGEDGTEIRATINMGEAASPREQQSPDTSFKSVAEEPEHVQQQLESIDLFQDESDATPSKAKGTPKRKQSFGAKIASPFRRVKKDQTSTPSSSSGAAKKEENPHTSCATQ